MCIIVLYLSVLKYSVFAFVNHAFCIVSLLGLRERFRGVLRRFGISTGSGTNRDLGFDGDIFPMASALDPSYAFHWLGDHAGTEQEREELRQHLIGMPALVAYIIFITKYFDVIGLLISVKSIN